MQRRSLETARHAEVGGGKTFHDIHPSASLDVVHLVRRSGRAPSDGGGSLSDSRVGIRYSPLVADELDFSVCNDDCGGAVIVVIIVVDAMPASLDVHLDVVILSIVALRLLLIAVVVVVAVLRLCALGGEFVLELAAGGTGRAVAPIQILDPEVRIGKVGAGLGRRRIDGRRIDGRADVVVMSSVIQRREGDQLVRVVREVLESVPG
ncbi:hypothetical protein F4820DRAFT_112521 [Hypoxylon rubiginosum]|uniref:Uncharacterized protein n=1 Tax=Hypoxylon rubiginosum TaxID=110542 RepID=A0ACB9ZAZ1_9PEZI|nr:hypothetical protein F4820DRAFT_112521 [Hypoxylon rubiginosum]